MRETDQLSELKKSATYELDQMDKAFALTKTFSKMFDVYTKKLQMLITGLLEEEGTNESSDVINTLKFQNFDSFRRVPLDLVHRRQRSEKSEYEHGVSRGVTGSMRRQNMNELPTRSLNRLNAFSDEEERLTINDATPAKDIATKDGVVISALQLQNFTISKIIDAGETNSKNLRDILDKMFSGKDNAKEMERLADKNVKLRTKLKGLRLELESKDKEMQKLAIELAVNQNVVKDIGFISNSLKQETVTTVNSQKLIIQPCRSCEILKSENSSLTSSLNFTSKRVLVLSQQIEAMQQEFMELYKTAQESITSNYVKIDQSRQWNDESPSMTGQFHARNKASLDSNYNTIISKLDNIEAELTNHNVLRSDHRFSRGRELSVTSNDFANKMNEISLQHNSNLIELKYSDFNSADLRDKKHMVSSPQTPYAEFWLLDSKTATMVQTLPVSKPSSSRHSPIQQTKRRSERHEPLNTKNKVTSKIKTIYEVPKHQNFKKRTRQAEEVHFEESPLQSPDVNSPRNLVESEERYSLVHMSTSSQNSLESDDNPFKLQLNPDSNGVVRISFAKGAINHSWADPRSSRDYLAMQRSIRLKTPTADDLNDFDEVMEIELPHEFDEQFYTFSNSGNNSREY